MDIRDNKTETRKEYEAYLYKNTYCYSCRYYNGGRRDICVDKNKELIDLRKIKVPTQVICGGSDPYLNYDLVNLSLKKLPKGSELNVIDGGAHVIMYEKPYYKGFQNKLIKFLNK